MEAQLKAALKAANLRGLVAPSPNRWGSLIKCFRSILAADAVLNAIVPHRDFEGTAIHRSLEPIDKYINKFQSDNVPVSDVYQAFISLPKEFLGIAGISSEQKYYLVKLTAERFKFMYAWIRQHSGPAICR
ncbi:hypothetical protein PsorP6_015793 [Peronosclerospora sorghi]|uniref:Uncharacterized protein n=1 Tax=Peronosclerospora sorghi TaxID=230839 RepID=A0ACC0WN25_9STRA|nr:hypothetical protein PsorP6_015793 [Peronosclerospora sorghi]